MPKIGQRTPILMSSPRPTDTGVVPDTDPSDAPTLLPSPDPSADEAVLINNELAKLGPGGTLVLGPGTYAIGTAITLLPGQTIIGRGAAIVPSGNIASLVEMAGRSTITGVLLQNRDGLATTAIDLTGETGSVSHVLSNRIIGFSTAVRIDTGESDIESSFFLANGTAISSSQIAGSGTIIGNYVLGGNGLDLAGAIAPGSSMNVVSNILLPGIPGAFGIRVISGASINIARNVVDQVLSGPGITIQGGGGLVGTVAITDNYVGANLSATAATNGIEVYGPSITNVSFNTLAGWNGYDLDVSGARALNIEGNNLSSTSDTGNVRLESIQRATLLDNELENKVASLIEIDPTTSTAIGNTFGSMPIFAENTIHTDNRGDLSQDQTAAVAQFDNSAASSVLSSSTQALAQSASGSNPGTILDASALVSYGALPLADNASVINAALARLYPGDTLVLPAGTYGIEAPIQLDGRNLVGAGTTLVPIAAMTSAIVVTGGFSGVSGLRLSNTEGNASAGIAVDKPANNLPTSIQDNTVEGFACAISLQGDNFSVQGNSLVDNTIGVYLGGGTLNGRVSGNNIVGGSGIDLEGGDQQPEGVDISENTISPGEPSSYGLLVRSGFAIQITGNVINDMVGGSGVVLDASESPVAYMSVIGNFIGGSPSHGPTVGSGISINGNVTNTTIAQNRIVNWTGFAVEATGANKLDIAKNSFDSMSPLGNVSLRDVGNATILGNMLGSASDPIVSAGSTNALEIGNVSSAVVVQQDSSNVPLGILEPNGSSLAIRVTGLPSIGSINRADGAAISMGDALTGSELTDLTFTPTVGLSDQSASFSYSVSDPAGNSSNETVMLTVLGAGLSDINPQLKGAFAVRNDSTGLSGGNDGTTYTGPLTYLQRQFIWHSTQDITAESDIPNVFIHGGGGNDTLQVTGGSNVLDGGEGSNVLIGGIGADGGMDTFFTDARGTGIVWDTLVNFHSGDYATLWGFDRNVSSWNWEGVSGNGQYTGATLQADVHGVGDVDATITFAGLTMIEAQKLEVTSGSIGGNGYLLLHSQGP